MGFKSRTYPREAPLNLLSKLLVFVRTPEGQSCMAEEFEDRAWCVADNISSWAPGWWALQRDGYVEAQEVNDGNSADEDSVDLLATYLAVRLTEKGLNYALQTMQTDGVLREKAEREQEEVADRNADRAGFGQF